MRKRTENAKSDSSHYSLLDGVRGDGYPAYPSDLLEAIVTDREAIDKIREEVDEAAEGGKSAGGKATKEVREAIDALEDRVEKLRKRDKE